jgi:signal transduction histidine kinase/CheY-like chemotaxis protein
MLRVRSERDVDGFINRYRCRDGGYRHLEWRAHQHGDLVYGVARDVTDRLAMEAEMAAARRAAEAANQAKSEFLANMSHEIRTPLNGVIGVAALLAETELTAAQQRMVELILTSGTTLERVVSDILDFSKIEAGRLEINVQPFDLRPEIEAILEMYRLHAQEKGLAFSARFAAQASGQFVGDVVRIKQVLGNLISNALKFTARGEIRTRIDLREAEGKRPAELVLQVSDTGIGFDEAFAQRLFQRFSQADASITRQFGGTGLGLSICQALVRMMGGTLVARSRPGRGSVFKVRLPVPRLPVSPGLARAAAPRPSAREMAGRLEGLRVLLAEDHAVNQKVVALILAPLDARLTITENGEDAVRAFMAEDFDVVLMDMQMPVMDGLTATRAIRVHEGAGSGRRRTPVIMLSANALRQHLEEAHAAGADLHLAKPVAPASLIEALVRVTDKPGIPS